ncbi:phosphohistidine phosphatase [Arboricoccus pini]|uniref:Phosphohistidine phosphatase n=1 Tax=Arboricoccus pini TaxID=1963835 RepID=A0A212QNW8_9PROT|nr:phosphohistidine phosphatase [Arboricoccus pini]
MAVTVRRLLLLRHAKSSWDDRDLADHTRPLALRGRTAAQTMGQFIKSQGLMPDRVLSSDSCRTRQTAEIVLGIQDRMPSVEWLAGLYLASAWQILTIIGEQGGTASSLLVLGHEPGIGVLANVLAGTGNDAERAAMKKKFPTTSLAIIEFRIDRWLEIAVGEGQLIRFVRPRDLAA